MSVTDLEKQICEVPVELATVAVHEAGHIVAAHLFGRRTIMATIDPDTYSSGMVWPGGGLGGVRAAREEMVFLAAGGAAERRLALGGDHLDSTDRIQMDRVAKKIHGLLVEEEAMNQELDRAHARAAELVRRHWADLLRVALSLIEHHHLVKGIRHDYHALESLDGSTATTPPGDDDDETSGSLPREVGRAAARRNQAAVG